MPYGIRLFFVGVPYTYTQYMCMYMCICMCQIVIKFGGKFAKNSNIFILIGKQAFTFYSHWGIICSEKNRAWYALLPNFTLV